MEENKNGEKKSHHGDHCCQAFKGCCGSHGKFIKIFLALVIAVFIFCLGLNFGSHFGRYKGAFYGPGAMMGGRYFRGGDRDGQACRFQNKDNSACPMQRQLNQASPEASNNPLTDQTPPASAPLENANPAQ